MTNTDQSDDEVTEMVDEICKEYARRKYKTAFDPVIGDVNADGGFNIADLVLFQKWLLASPDTKLENWQNADLCRDSKLDAFDLCLMRRELVGR